MPENMKEYWHWFLRLHNHRPSGFGLCPIPYVEMQAFFNLNSIYVEPYEIEVIELFDNIALKILSEQEEKRQVLEKSKASNK